MAEFSTTSCVAQGSSRTEPKTRNSQRRRKIVCKSPFPRASFRFVPRSTTEGNRDRGLVPTTPDLHGCRTQTRARTRVWAEKLLVPGICRVALAVLRSAPVCCPSLSNTTSQLIKPRLPPNLRDLRDFVVPPSMSFQIPPYTHNRMRRSAAHFAASQSPYRERGIRSFSDQDGLRPCSAAQKTPSLIYSLVRTQLPQTDRARYRTHNATK